MIRWQRLAPFALALLSCGGQARDRSGVPPAAHAGAASSGAASGASSMGSGRDADAAGLAVGGSAGTLSAVGDSGNAELDAGADAGASLADEARCNAFLPLWVQRQNEREPGSPSPSDPSAPCFECIEANKGGCNYPISDTCSAATACVERHCLCVTANNATCAPADYPDDLCSCLEPCLPPGRGCYDGWLYFMACEASACSSACTP